MDDIRWLSRSTCHQMATRVREVLDHWAHTWGLPPVADIAGVAVMSTAPDTVGLVDLMGDWPPALNCAVSRLLMRVDVPGSVIAEATVRCVAAALKQALRQGRLVDVGGARRRDLPGHQGLRVTTHLLGHRCRLFISVADLLAGGWLQSPPLLALPRVDMEKALAAVAVRLVAEVGRASVSVDEWIHLAEGDVLLLEEPLDGPLRMRVPSCSAELRASLGASPDASRRAVRWLPS